jgi:hypothetical protein
LKGKAPHAHDILLKGRTRGLPGQRPRRRAGRRDPGGRIAAIQPDILPSAAKEVIGVGGRIVLPGLVDTHAHIYTYVSGRFGLPADMAGVHSGVTSLVDQGGASCMTLPGFNEFIAKPAHSRVFSFISAYVVGGLEGHFYPGLYGPEHVDVDATVKAARANPGLVRGVKAHAELGRHGALRAGGAAKGRADRPRGGPAGVLPFRPALANARDRQQRRRPGLRSCHRSCRCCAPATSWRTLSPATPAASWTAAPGRCMASCRRRSMPG